MFGKRTFLGILLGLLLAAAILAAAGRPKAAGAPPSGPFTPDCGGALRELVIQYTPAGAALTGTAYHDFLSQLPSAVAVHVLCPDEPAFAALLAQAGKVSCQLIPFYTRHAMTCWSRDRWVALAPAKPGLPVTLWLPRGEQGTEFWPERAGDQRTGPDLAAALAPGVAAQRSELFFEGGDFVADEETVFITQAVLRRNLQQTVQTREELERKLTEKFKRRVVLLHDAPEHHAGMYLMLAGGHTAVVGDPQLAQSILGTGPGALPFCPCGDDCTAATQKLFDNVAEQCAAAGYRVIRIPEIAGQDSRTFITYTNVILDQCGEHRTVYMPVYQHTEKLNAAAAEVWRALGYEVRRVDCGAVYTNGGVLRCLVSLLRRD